MHLEELTHSKSILNNFWTDKVQRDLQASKDAARGTPNSKSEQILSSLQQSPKTTREVADEVGIEMRSAAAMITSLVDRGEVLLHSKRKILSGHQASVWTIGIRQAQREQIIEHLKLSPSTSREIAADLKMSARDVSSVVATLQYLGKVEKCGNSMSGMGYPCVIWKYTGA